MLNIGWPLLFAALVVVLLAVTAGAVLWQATSSSRRHEIRAEDIDPEAFRD